VNCWKFAGPLLDRVNTPLNMPKRADAQSDNSIVFFAFAEFELDMIWLSSTFAKTLA